MPDRNVLLEILEKGGAGVIFLVDEEIFRNRYVHPDRDPLRILLNTQGQFAGSIAVVPITILYDRTPRRTIRPFWESFLGDPDRPGPLKRILIAIRKWTVPELLVGEPIHLIGEFEEFGSGQSWDELPYSIRKDLIANINDQIRINRGPEKLSRTEIKERVLREPPVQRAVSEVAAQENTSTVKIRKKAESYVHEIAADQRIQVIHFLYYLFGWIFSHVFDGIDWKESQFETLKEIGRKRSLIFVPCHKSHFDYMVVPYLTFVNRMSVPHVAAGKNLSFWPLGSILRHAGAFFLRRSFKGLDLYPAVFAAYLKVLLQERFNIKFYLEGGRSRTGKLLPPRVGMLGFLVKAVEEGAVEDLTFVPTFMGYERIPEEASYLTELSGMDKKKETILSVLRAREVLKIRYGRVYVRFGDPVSLKSFFNKWKAGSEPHNIPEMQDRALVNDLAYHLMSGIVRAGVVTPTDLTAAALLCGGDSRSSHSELLQRAECLRQALRNEGIEVAGSLNNLEEAVTGALGIFSNRGLIEIERDTDACGEIAYVINPQKRVNLEFYGNSLVNYLWPASILATVLMEKNGPPAASLDAVKEEFAALGRLLSKELIVDPLRSYDETLERPLTFFREKEWDRATNEERVGNKSFTRLELFRRILADLVLAYYLVLAALDEIGERTSERDFTRKVLNKAQDLSQNQQVLGSLPISPLTISNALSQFDEMGIVDYDVSGKQIRSLLNPSEREKWKQRLALALGLPGYLP